MKLRFRLRGKDVVFTWVEGVVAVQPTTQLRQRANQTKARMVAKFGATARDDSFAGTFGIALPSKNRKLFERAGWLFVEPQAAVAQAANTRDHVDDAEAVRPVVINPAGELLVTTGLVTVRLDPQLPEAEAKAKLKAHHLRLERQLKFAPNAFEVRLPARKPLQEAIEELLASPDYLFAEPEFLQAITGRHQPSDPDYDRQWQHMNDGSNGGVAGADIHAEAAWDVTRGIGPNGPMRIAIIDNGIHVAHPDLKDGIRSGGYFQSDGSGTATFIRYQAGDAGFPSGNHGTFCLGMAGARMDNGRGGCGSAPEADLIAIACLGDQVGTQTTLARAVAYAADPSREDGQAQPREGADVISVSLGPNGADWLLTSVLDLAIQFAVTQGRGGRGVPVFWAVSNGSFEVSRDEVCSHPQVIAVGRSNRHDLEDGSAFGPELDFLAPGRDVYSTTGSNGYNLGTGTSYATPLAAGVGALVLSQHPEFTAVELRTRLRETCDKIGSVTYDPQGHHSEYGFGRINAESAVQ